MFSAEFFVIFLLSIFVHQLVAEPIVTIANGDVRGTVMQTVNGRQFYAFRGIPFAKPPKGHLRFQPPELPENWVGVFNATENGKICMQVNGDQVVGDEDCLFIYVYTPLLPPNTSRPAKCTRLLPVLSFIHGGGFQNGAPWQEFGIAQRYLDFDVVLVSFGYRLAAFGFLSTNDSSSMGNYGMLDQVLALKWIQTNIASFGGDKTKVTLDGISAGAASVGFHILSQASTGLFRATISESGSATSYWAFIKNPRKYAEQLALNLTCNIDNSSILVDCLRNKSAEEIVIGTKNINGYETIHLSFAPCKEDPVKGRFLKQDPITIFKEGTFNKVPSIVGTTKADGMFLYQATENLFKTIDKKFYDEILPELIYKLIKCDRNLIKVTNAVKREYFDKIDVNNRTQVIKTAIDLYSDVVFKSPADITVRLLAKNNVPVYMYSFEYAGSISNSNVTGEPEVNHVEEVYYTLIVYGTLTKQDKFISDELLNMWVNFATYLIPRPIGNYMWTPTTLEKNLKYLEIATNSLKMKKGFLTSRMNFWRNTVPKIVAE